MCFYSRFARDLVITKELDPTYDIMVGHFASKDFLYKSRFLTHYLMFYDLKGALFAANTTKDDTFFNYVADNYEKWDRGTARRHSRGAVGMKYLRNMQNKFSTPMIFWSRAIKSGQRGYDSLVRFFVGEADGCGVGPYFQWKTGDLLRNVLGERCPLTLTDGGAFLPDVPLKEIQKNWPDGRTTLSVITEVLGWIQGLPAPGLGTFRCGYAEVETVLCAMYGHRKGTYKFGQDIAHQREILIGTELFKHCPPPVDPLLRAEYA